jgi:hypothetical protein
MNWPPSCNRRAAHRDVMCNKNLVPRGPLSCCTKGRFTQHARCANPTMSEGCAKPKSRPFIIRYSLFDIPCSIFLVQYSLFKIPCSIFLVQYSLFKIPCSKFLVQYSIFMILLPHVSPRPVTCFIAENAEALCVVTLNTSPALHRRFSPVVKVHAGCLRSSRRKLG